MEKKRQLEKPSTGADDFDAERFAERVATQFDFAAARAAVFDWFDANGRRFPWRDDPTPYRVWISEMMLQQTTTQTVVGYFERFLARFPDVATLAAADEEDVLAHWEGLGYYRRAKALRLAARDVVAQFGGVFPEKYDDVLALPGVGRYATGAILSFGFDRRFPILEANTTRLHSRTLGLRLETTRAAAQKILWRFAENWLPPEQIGREIGIYRRLNGALTDLGRLVCSPSEPRCDDCPLARFCESRRLGLQKVVPTSRPKPQTIERTDVAFWIERGDLFDFAEFADVEGASETDLLLIRRPENALWAGLWDFPRFETSNSLEMPSEISSDAALADRLAFFLEEEVGAAAFDYRPGRVLKTVCHSVTKYRITLRFCRLVGANSAFSVGKKTLFDSIESVENKRLNDAMKARRVRTDGERRGESNRVAAEVRWVAPDELAAYPLSSPARKLATFVVENSSERQKKRLK